MTKSELREMDAKVAEALGWSFYTNKPEEDKPYKVWLNPEKNVRPVPHYTTDIAAAWTLVEEMRKEHDFDLRLSEDVIEAVFWPKGNKEKTIEVSNGIGDRADTAPLAICQAFLAVKEGE